MGCVAGFVLGCAGKDLPGDLEKDTIIEECHNIDMVGMTGFSGGCGFVQGRSVKSS